MKTRKAFLSILLTAAVAVGTLTAAPAAVAASPELTYTKLPTNPVIAAQKTYRGLTIQDMALQNGELYTGYGDYAANTGPIQVTSMNTTTKAFKNWVSTPNEEINTYREIDGKLYTTQIDPRLAWNANVGYSSNVTGKWATSNVTPFIHVFDIASTDGKDLWMAGSIAKADGKTPDGAAIKRSTDGGKTWTTVKRTTSFNGADAAEFDRYYWLASINGKMYMKPAVSPTPGTTNPIEVWDNGNWSTIEDPINAVNVTEAQKVVTFKNKIYTAGYYGVRVIDGTTVSRSTSYPLMGPSDFYVTTDKLYALSPNGVAATTDGVSWSIVTGTVPNAATESGFYGASLAVDTVTDTLYIAGTNGSVYMAANIGSQPAVTAAVLSGVTDVNVASETIFDPLAGVKAVDAVDGDITSKITYTSTIPLNGIPGNYVVKYSVTNSKGFETNAERVVTVKPALTASAPTITNVADAFIWAEQGYTLEGLAYGVKGLDTIDGDITSKIVTESATKNFNVKGDYIITYTLTNSNKMTTVVNRKITVGSLEPNLVGATDVTIAAGTSFDPLAGVTASDPFTGDLTSEIVVTGSVDTSKAGRYTLTYVTDGGFGYTSINTRIVTVTAAPATITGATNVTVNSGSKFDVKAGVTASDAVDGDLSAKITVTGTVNTAKVGTYKLVYTVKNSNNQTSTVERVVTVKKAVKPALTGATAYALPFGGTFDPLAGVTASDAVDGDLTGKIVITGTVDTMKSGRYILKYQATNSGNLTTTVTRYVTVKAAAKSTITGAAAARIQFGSSFDPLAGVTASDPYDGDVTSKIVVTGAIDSMKSGIQRVTYKVTNTGNVTTTVTRQVTVVKNAAPVFSATATTYKKNAAYDPAAVITVSDAEDGVITNFTFTTNVNTAKTGRYVTTYTAVDRFGAKTVKKVTITVVN